MEPSAPGHVEAPARDVVDDGALLGHVHRVVEGVDQAVRAECNRLGLMGQDHQQVQRRAEIRLSAAVAIGDLDGVEPRLLGEDAFLDHGLERAAASSRSGSGWS